MRGVRNSQREFWEMCTPVLISNKKETRKYKQKKLELTEKNESKIKIQKN